MTNKKTPNPFNAERGSLLVALLAVLILFGATYMASNSLESGDMISPDDARIQTKAEMEVIADHIAAYVHNYNRLPCAALPSQPRNVLAFGRENGDETGCGRYEGLLPWRTLGLPDRFATDGWNRFYTYAVSPVFAATGPGQFPDTDIMANCREADNWVITFSGNTRNINASKARFCCPDHSGGIVDPSRDIQLFNGAFQMDSNGPVPGMGRASPTSPAPVDTVWPSPPPLPVPPPISQEAFAYVLISHGDNGYGAYLANNTNTRKDTGVLVPPPNFELENANGGTGLPGDMTFQVRLTNYTDVGYGTTGATAYFDDIVLYRTQYSTFSELNGASCRTAY